MSFHIQFKKTWTADPVLAIAYPSARSVRQGYNPAQITRWVILTESFMTCLTMPPFTSVIGRCVDLGHSKIARELEIVP